MNKRRRHKQKRRAKVARLNQRLEQNLAYSVRRATILKLRQMGERFIHTGY